MFSVFLKKLQYIFTLSSTQTSQSASPHPLCHVKLAALTDQFNQKEKSDVESI